MVEKLGEWPNYIPTIKFTNFLGHKVLIPVTQTEFPIRYLKTNCPQCCKYIEGEEASKILRMAYSLKSRRRKWDIPIDHHGICAFSSELKVLVTREGGLKDAAFIDILPQLLNF